MIKYYTFKKGQPVPMWLLNVTDSCGAHVDGVAVFAARGKVALNTETGATVMWAAKRHATCIIKLSFPRQEGQLSTKFHDGGNTMFRSCGAEHLTPLSNARRMRYMHYTSTKCEPLPEVKP